MKITITQAEEAGMPKEMIENCRQLIERRIRKTLQSVPAPGTDVTILYSDKDPMMTSGEVDDTAYDIYFTVEKATGKTLEDAEIECSLVV